MTKPNINVTPLIDVLLVLLIIFMIVAPSKPTDFKTRVPQEPKKDEIITPNPHTLVVSVMSDSSLRLNREETAGTIQTPENLIKRLEQVFKERTENGVYAEGMESRNDLPTSQKILKTVFIKAPRTLGYGSVVKVIDAVKIAGANPISLQIDDLE
jgi:biopolymer transport protein ExbD